jgi:hypothetical protein
MDLGQQIFLVLAETSPSPENRPGIVMLSDDGGQIGISLGDTVQELRGIMCQEHQFPKPINPALGNIFLQSFQLIPALLFSAHEFQFRFCLCKRIVVPQVVFQPG